MNITSHREFTPQHIKCAMCKRPVGFDYYYVIKGEKHETLLCESCLEKHPAVRQKVA